MDHRFKIHRVLFLVFFSIFPLFSQEEMDGVGDILSSLLRKYRCKNFLDLPCGNSDWIQSNWKKRGGAPVYIYVGMDPDPEKARIQENKYKNYWRWFGCLDPKFQPLPQSDLILCQDLLNFYSDVEIFEFIENLKQSGTKYFLASQFFVFKENEVPTGAYREINFLFPPFNFPFPIENIPLNQEKSLSLWEIRSLPSQKQKQTIEHPILCEKNPPQRDKRIALVTFISNSKDAHRGEWFYPYPQMVQFGTRSKKLYARKNGYDFYIGTQKIYECGNVLAPDPNKLSIHWMKVPMLEKHMENHDWVVWMDADTIILNPYFPLESLIDEQFDVILGTANLEEPTWNTGFILVKNCPWSRSFLAEWWQNSEEKEEGQWDREMLGELLSNKSPEYHSHIGYLSGRNNDLAAKEYQPGDFMVHFYGSHGYYLYKLFQEFEKEYKWILDELENSLTSSKYPD